MAKHTLHSVVTYAHAGKPRRAQVTEVHPDTGAVLGLAVYAIDAATGEHSGAIDFGVPNPAEATAPEHRSIDGHFWK